MKKILIISYYFPPCVGIAPNRPAAFANDFSKSNDVKVITRHWHGNENQWEDYLTSFNKPRNSEKVTSRLEIIRLPYHSKLRKSNKLRTAIDLLRGQIDSEIDSLQFFEEASNIIEEWKPDFLLVSAPPLNLVKLASLLHARHQIPYLVDFRDFENEIILNQLDSTNLSDRIHFYYRSKYTLKYLKHCSYIFSVNKEITDYFNSRLGKPTEIIFNGFENRIFDRFKGINEIKGELFHVSIIGTIYPNQDLNIFLEAFQKVLSIVSEPAIRFNFIGTDAIQEIGDLIRKAIPASHLMLTKRIPRDEALKHLENSHLVWQPEMPDYKGIYTGKIFEYLGAKRIIMVAPSTGDVLDKLLKETEAGYSFQTSNEIAGFILEKYREWKDNGILEYNGKEKAISFYSRENQSKRLLNAVEKQL